MNDAIISILSRATLWMDAKEIAAAGKFRSAGNVSVALKQLEKSGRVECRSLGQNERVWKHVDKDFGEAKTQTKLPKANPAGVTTKAVPMALSTDKLAQANTDLAVENEALRRERDVLARTVANQEIEQKRLRAELMALEKRREVPATVEIRSTFDPTISGYLLRAPKRRPKVFAKEESAKRAALSAAKAVHRGEVYALIKIGKAVRGTEWVAV